MANPFDQFDAPAVNPFDQFDSAPSLAALGDQARAVTAALPQGSPVKAKTWGDTMKDIAMGGASFADRTGAIAASEARKGLAALASAPGLLVDAVNHAPRLANFLPGVSGVGPITERPFMGSAQINDAVNATLAAPTRAAQSALGRPTEDPKPENAFERVVGRVGYETGAAALPAGAALTAAARLGREGVRQLSPLARFFVEPAAVAPVNFAGREATLATAAGTGAGVANEVAGNPQHGNNFWSDFTGSAAGLGLAAAAKNAAGVAQNAIAALTGGGRFADDVAKEAVAQRVLGSSQMLAQQAAESGGKVDTAPLVARLRAPSAAEEAIPGFRANIGDRSQDPGLATYAFNQDARSPGSANARRSGNEAAITARMESLDPAGDPAQFRSALMANRDQQIAGADAAARTARAAFEAANQQVQPVLRDATARGSSIRSALQDASDAANAGAAAQWRPLNEARERVDVGPLAEAFGARREALPLNDRQRFLPNESRVPELLLPEEQTSAMVPLAEIMSVRSGLTDDIRTARAAGEQQRARVADQFRRDVDDFTEASIPPELQQQYDRARAATRDVKDRFTRPGEGVAETLRTREGGGYQLDDSAVPRVFNQPDQGKITDFRSLMREAGQDPRARNALADDIMSDVQARGVLERPEALQRYLSERSIVLGQFPELRTRLEAAGTAGAAASFARDRADDATARLTTPSRSAQASYLQHADESTVNAVRGLVSGPRPREAAQELLHAAGNSPDARRNARAAFWEVVKTQKMAAPGVTGEDRWSGRKLKAMFDNPKVAAVADELWADAPQELADIKTVFSALAGSEGSARARAAGSSGTAQALSEKFDPAMSASAVASRFRSVNRGQLSPTIAAVDLGATWLRRRPAQVQARPIDAIASAVVNNPGLAADLLERFNPADYAARRRLIQQKYGVRATQLLNVMDEWQDDDPVKEAITRDR